MKAAPLRLLLLCLCASLSAGATASKARRSTKGASPGAPAAASKACPPPGVGVTPAPGNIPASLKAHAQYLGVSYARGDLTKPKFKSLKAHCGGAVSQFVAFPAGQGGVSRAYLFKTTSPLPLWRVFSTHPHPTAGGRTPPSSAPGGTPSNLTARSRRIASATPSASRGTSSSTWPSARCGPAWSLRPVPARA